MSYISVSARDHALIMRPGQQYKLILSYRQMCIRRRIIFHAHESSASLGGRTIILKLLGMSSELFPADVDDGKVVKGILGVRDAGDPVEVAQAYEQQGADNGSFSIFRIEDERTSARGRTNGGTALCP